MNGLARSRRTFRLRLSRELTQALAVDVVTLMVERYRHVERVPTCHEVGGARVFGYSVERCVRLDEPPVTLFGELGVDVFAWRDQPVEPGRQIGEPGWEIRALEDQEGAYHLDPRRPALRSRADDDVAFPERKPDPATAVLVRRSVSKRLRRSRFAQAATATSSLYLSPHVVSCAHGIYLPQDPRSP